MRQAGDVNHFWEQDLQTVGSFLHVPRRIRHEEQNPIVFYTRGPQDRESVAERLRNCCVIGSFDDPNVQEVRSRRARAV